MIESTWGAFEPSPVRPNFQSWQRKLLHKPASVSAAEIEPIDFVESDIEIDFVPEHVLHVLQGITSRNSGSIISEIQPRLRALQAQFVDDFDRQIEQKSIFALTALLLSTRGIRKPLLSASSSGCLIATWRKDGCTLSIRFVRVDELHFAFSIAKESDDAFVGPRYGKAHAAAFFSASPEARKIAS